MPGFYCDVDFSKAGLIGGGYTNTGGFYTHDGNGTGTNLYSLIWMSNCVGSVGIGGSMTPEGQFIVEDSIMRQLSPGPLAPVVRRCRIDDAIVNGYHGLDVSDSIIRMIYTPIDQRGGSANFTNRPGKYYTFNRCTFDFGMTRNQSFSQNQSLFNLTANGDARMSNCVVILPPTNHCQVVYLTDATSSFSAANNVYYGTNTMAGATNGCVYVDPKLLDGSRPAFASPAIGLGSGGTQRDITGALFDDRVTAGAYEYDPRNTDSNGDEILDWWVLDYGLKPDVIDLATTDSDHDGYTTYQEWITDTSPIDPLSFFKVSSITADPELKVWFTGSTNRIYTLFNTTNVFGVHLGDPTWNAVQGQVEIRGTGRQSALTDTNIVPANCYRVLVSIPK